MRKTNVMVIGLTLLLASCNFQSGRGRAAFSTSPQSQTKEEAVSEELPQTASESALLSDWEGMSFVDKNAVYLDLAATMQAAGVDISSADELYLKSIEASMAGSTNEADAYLLEAVITLIDTKE